MVYLKLFATFLKIGALSFGGGYGMISLIREECLANAWLTEGELLNFIAVAESTPGPIAVNIATFVGSSQGGILGALSATLGVVLPAFLIILAIAALLKNIMKFGGVKAALGSVRPSVTALVLSTAATMALGTLFGIQTVKSAFCPDWKSLALLAGLAVVYAVYKLLRKKEIPPVLLIIISGVAGIFIF